ncbi:MAG: transcription-repair coupling factor [Gammaproteobacteria bacterium]|nr:transcription-repair coupling factor [Gammaproteobacteria bacterium]
MTNAATARDINLETNILAPVIPQNGTLLECGQLYGSATGLLISTIAQQHSTAIIVATPDARSAYRLLDEIRFYNSDIPSHLFPDWETLPYDVFSPHQDIVSERLTTLCQLPQQQKGIVIVPISTLLHRLPPCSYIDANSLVLDIGQQFDVEKMRMRFEKSGYRCVSQVMEHGEFAVRGSLVDLFPMGSEHPFRIDLFDDEIESIRGFDPENQRSDKTFEQLRLLPAREFPLDENGITRFRQRYRNEFEGNASETLIYREVSQGNSPTGIEYYLPLFYEETATLFDYLPNDSVYIQLDGCEAAAANFWLEANERYEQARHDIQRPILAPDKLFLSQNILLEQYQNLARVNLKSVKTTQDNALNYQTQTPPELYFNHRDDHPESALKNFIQSFHGRLLFVAESAGRREAMLELLHRYDIFPAASDGWSSFKNSESQLSITVAPLENGALLRQPEAIAVIAEPQLFGEQVLQKRRRKERSRDTDAVIKSLSELQVGAPVVHEDHGVGRYRGLETITTSGITTEFLVLEYANSDKLYVPVSTLNLISRYSGTSADNAPLHRLGTEQWQKAKKKAAQRACDVAAELLDVYARRAARKGHAFPQPDDAYANFSSAFPFEETPDQESAIEAVISDMVSSQPMDRLVCGDVGFGKTEVAMRAAFVATNANHQVAVLVPTTLLAQQHYQNFLDRFADCPLRIEVLSRFGAKHHSSITQGLADGTVDIVIGTHKLLQESIKFKRLGLVIIDEEHRFGVRQKERFKALRSEVDVLTLTATPIPRTLNMSLAGMRDLSIIATPPKQRVAIKTFVSEWNDQLLKEAMWREIKRGGQIYFVHNKVEDIERVARRIKELLPEAEVEFAHGQMRERELEKVMLDFYHQRFHVLVCTTIIETGIDVPTANTIIIDRADRFGLAQLYQLRGRVGRSHHRAYAYLLVPSKSVISADAKKRLEAIESLEELGAGFTLATHDLEIRGAGELLGSEQSGQIQEIGFSMYSQLLERAVNDLKSGKTPDFDKPLKHGCEVDLRTPALIPEDYLYDVHTRLVIYKRIANAASVEALDELQVEMIDRFGLLPDTTKTLFRISEIKIQAEALGIRKIEAGPTSGRVLFDAEPDIDPMAIIKLMQDSNGNYRMDGPETLRFKDAMEELDDRFSCVEALMIRLAEK